MRLLDGINSDAELKTRVIEGEGIRMTSTPHVFDGTESIVDIAEHTLRARGIILSRKTIADVFTASAEVSIQRINLLQAEVDRLRGILSTPQIEPFMAAAIAEAQHQVFRWGSQHDEKKDAFDWYSAHRLPRRQGRAQRRVWRHREGSSSLRPRRP